MDILIALLSALALCLILQAGFWWHSLRTQNAGIVDVIWALTIGLSTLVYWILSPTQSLYADFFMILVGVWSGRMSLYLYIRYKNSSEDGRYIQLRKEWSSPGKSLVPGKTVSQKFLSFFLIQGVLSWLLTAPFVALFFTTTPPAWNLGMCALFAIIFLSILGEALSDIQLYRFKKNPENHGKILNTGLWTYSRHPNYFFEICNWIGFALWCSFICSGLWAWVSPLFIAFFILKITGVPATDAHNPQTKGEAWKAYYANTNALFPFFKLKKAA